MNKQTAMPKSGDTVASLTTTLGEIKIKIFKDEAPLAAENFITHAKNGYYNNLIFHRVIKDFMIQGGDPLGTGTGGESIWGRPFNDEFTPELHNLRGALSMANSGPSTNGSQFFIVQANSVPKQMLDQMEELKDRGFPSEVIEDYKNLGGTPWLDFRHTVFGQVFEGMDVVDLIANAKTNGSDKPLEDIKILSIDISEL